MLNSVSVQLILTSLAYKIGTILSPDHEMLWAKMHYKRCLVSTSKRYITEVIVNIALH